MSITVAELRDWLSMLADTDRVVIGEDATLQVVEATDLSLEVGAAAE